MHRGTYHLKPSLRYFYDSFQLIGYQDHFEDTESSRLLKRAEFLKAVCEKEGVEWLPENPCGEKSVHDQCQCCKRPSPSDGFTICGCECHKQVEDLGFCTMAEAEARFKALGEQIEVIRGFLNL